MSCFIIWVVEYMINNILLLIRTKESYLYFTGSLLYGVLQGSVLGPFIFTFYRSSISKLSIIRYGFIDRGEKMQPLININFFHTPKLHTKHNLDYDGCIVSED